jgi:hypothetical protein
MAGIFTFFDNAANIDANKILVDVLKRDEVRALIAELNTFGQLFEEGIDSEGRKLSDIRQPYATSTVQKKRREGLPTDRVTLFDTGKFYESWNVTILKNGDIEIEANTEVRANYDLEKDYGPNILGLTEESLSKISDFITPLFIEAFQAEVFRGV